MESQKNNNTLTVHLNIPQDWQDKLTSIAEKKNITIPQLITEIIGIYLGYNQTELELKNLKQQQQQLDYRLKMVEIKAMETAKLEERFRVLEKLVENIQKQIQAKPNSIPLPTLFPEENDDDSVDEPDEVLIDFLD
ncbi:MAG: hypothetical protein NZ901_05255 [Geminocystis sp.]|nr:hypothetical protein [Geminocystis sp.]HIK36480.1 hypothetical protein [Geminocystis sp. M7585_C2015_104]MCS7147582.1 hypothetical protein [Geminocystis sp.]MCX8077985.1 hypothetical protein [Geminocystis sp.]MDW8115275.1 hypothetical protein [Geminocystis sp.]